MAPTQPVTPLRQRMLDDMKLRNMAVSTRKIYVASVAGFAGLPFVPLLKGQRGNCSFPQVARPGRLGASCRARRSLCSIVQAVS